MKTVDVQVRGAGAVGRSVALALARAGLRVALTPAHKPAATDRADVRAYALNAASVALLRELKVWDSLPADAKTAVHDMRVLGDGAGRLDFSAWQQCVAELAVIVDASALDQALDDAVRFAPHIEVQSDPVDATLVAVCEGKHSSTREEFGVEFERWDCAQTAIAARLTGAAPHLGLARQRFRSPDVLALLPLDRPQPGASYALVWSLPTARAQALLALDDAAFTQALNEAAADLGGELTLASARAAWPLTTARAKAWHGPGWVLLGDAAHVVHPLAGQGLNLGLADVACLSRMLAGKPDWRSTADPRLLAAYARERFLPTLAMATVTDSLLTLFATQASPVAELRNQGLGLLNHWGSAKRWLASQALGT